MAIRQSTWDGYKTKHLGWLLITQFPQDNYKTKPMGQLSDKVLWMTKRKFTWDNLKVRAEVLRGGRGRGWVERGWGVGGWMWGGEERSTRVTYVSTSLLVFCVRPGVLTDTARGFSGWNVIVCLFYDVTSVSSPRRFCLGAVACAKNGCRIRPWQTYGNPPHPPLPSPSSLALQLVHKDFDAGYFQSFVLTGRKKNNRLWMGARSSCGEINEKIKHTRRHWRLGSDALGK